MFQYTLKKFATVLFIQLGERRAVCYYLIVGAIHPKSAGSSDLLQDGGDSPAQHLDSLMLSDTV